ncbi:hypothetical protein ABH917_004062 [Thermobifida halotolerans]
MSEPAEAFYLPRGDGRYEPTRATESPWDADSQHGGPPTALLGHLLDSAAGPDMRLARISADFLGAIPRRGFRVEVAPVRPGRRIALFEARMVFDGRPAVVARAWAIATGPTPPATGRQARPPALPGPEQDTVLGLTDWGYGEAVEWRYTRGGHGENSGEADVWTRVRIPLIEGGEAHRPGSHAGRRRLRQRPVRRPARGGVAVHPAVHDHHPGALPRGRLGAHVLPLPPVRRRTRRLPRHPVRPRRLPR